MHEFTETLHAGYTQAFSITRVLADEHSEFQHIQLFENPVFGRVLALDGIIQITERDEHTYSEMMVHPPVYEHGRVRRVLIAGGGDGAVAEEVLKHRSVQSVDLVEIDPRVIELSREFLGSVHGDVFADPRLRLHTEDAAHFLETRPDTYDLIIADRPDPVGAARSLFTQSFYRTTADALREAGIAIFQSGVPFFQADEFRAVCRHMRTVWAGVAAYVTATPTYTGGLMTLTRGSRTPLSESDLEAALERARRDAVPTATYAPDVHRAAYALPVWLHQLIASG